MGAVRQLVDELRRRGVTVHEWPGWDGRGNSEGGVGHRVTQIDPVGAVIHHTGSNYGTAYAGLVSSTRPELRGGCLCNFTGNEDGSLTVIASGLAWHAGPGVGPSLGPVLSRVPNIRNRMNRVTVGLEVVYPGAQPMRPEQYRTACVFAKTVADLFAGGDIECVRAHAETNGNAPGGSGKWDPGYSNGRTIDMAAFRRDAAAIKEDDMPSAQEIAAAVWGYQLKHGGVDASAIVVAADTLTVAQQGAPKLDVLVARAAADVDEEKLAAALAPTLVPAVLAAVASRNPGLTKEDVETAIREVLGSLASPA